MKKKRDSKRHLDTKKVCHPPSLSAQERAVNLHRLAPDIYEEASCSYLTAKEGGRGGKYVFRPLPLFPNSQNPDVSSFPIFSSEERVGRNKKTRRGILVTARDLPPPPPPPPPPSISPLRSAWDRDPAE